MNSLGRFANSLRMEINQKKTKVLVFDKPAETTKRISKAWKIDNMNIDEDTVYKYLGVIFKNDGSFTEHINAIKEKADKAYCYIVAKNKEWQGFNPKKHFSTYFIIQFYAELERHPLQLQWRIATIKYLKRLIELPEDRLAKKAYRQLILDDENSHFNWLSVANKIKQEHAIDVSDSVETIKSKIKSTLYSHLKENLTNCMYERKKLRAYATFKIDEV